MVDAWKGRRGQEEEQKIEYFSATIDVVVKGEDVEEAKENLKNRILSVGEIREIEQIDVMGFPEWVRKDMDNYLYRITTDRKHD